MAPQAGFSAEASPEGAAALAALAARFCQDLTAAHVSKMRFSSFDVYPKTLQEFRSRTLTGAFVSIGCAIVIALMALVEVADFMTVKRVDHLVVDTSRGQQLRINLNITFPALPCSVISLDTLDMSGNHAPDHMRDITKTRLDGKGRHLPPSPPESGHGEHGGRRLLFETHGAAADAHGGGAHGGGASGGGAGAHGGGAGAAHGGGAGQLSKPDLRQLGNQNVLLSKLLSELLPSVFEDKEAVAEMRAHIGEGCHIEGSLLVNKVAGNFHFAMAKADHYVLMNVYGNRESLNVSHVIHGVSFGEPYPDMVNPLDHTPKILHHGSGYFQYHIKVPRRPAPEPSRPRAPQSNRPAPQRSARDGANAPSRRPRSMAAHRAPCNAPRCRPRCPSLPAAMSPAASAAGRDRPQLPAAIAPSFQPRSPPPLCPPLNGPSRLPPHTLLAAPAVRWCRLPTRRCAGRRSRPISTRTRSSSAPRTSSISSRRSTSTTSSPPSWRSSPKTAALTRASSRASAPSSAASSPSRA